jgi:AraC-like DNA-binding protein
MQVVDASSDPRRAPPRTDSMLSFRRGMRVPQLDASREVHFLLHRGLRAYVVRARGVAVEKRLFTGSRLERGRGRRHLAQIVLAGRMRLHDGVRERWLEAGDVSLQHCGFPDERWEGERFEVVVLEWTPAWSDARMPSELWTTDRLAAADLARLASWGAVAAEVELSPERAAAHLAALLELLSCLGLPVRRAEARELIEQVPPPARELAAQLGASLSNLGQRPILVDLETALGRSSRHLRRGLGELHRAYDFPGGSWHQLLHWWRLTMATTLMTARGATTELVSEALGYGSPRAFCLAMAQAGLPSPGRVARLVDHLR